MTFEDAWVNFRDDMRRAARAPAEHLYQEGVTEGARLERLRQDAATREAEARGFARGYQSGQGQSPWDIDEDEVSRPEVEDIITIACNEGTTENAAGRLLAAWRTWFGVGGPGLFSRLQMKDDLRRVLAATEERVRREMVDVLQSAEEWMAEDGCDCGTDEPGTCALCRVRAATNPYLAGGGEPREAEVATYLRGWIACRERAVNWHDARAKQLRVVIGALGGQLGPSIKTNELRLHEKAAAAIRALEPAALDGIVPAIDATSPSTPVEPDP